MPELLHEFWTTGDSGIFGPVSENSDRERPILFPGARFVHELRASSLIEALKLHRKLRYNEEGATEDFEETPYTAEEFADQEAYLKIRKIVR